VDGDTVFVGDIDPSTKPGDFYALDAATGGVRWRLPLEHGPTGSPAVADGTVYVPMLRGQRHWLDDEDDAPPSPLQGGALYALDAATGDERWRFATTGTPTDPAVAGNQVFVADTDTGVLFALDAVTG